MEFRELFDRTPEQIRELTEVWVAPSGRPMAS